MQEKMNKNKEVRDRQLQWVMNIRLTQAMNNVYNRFVQKRNYILRQHMIKIATIKFTKLMQGYLKYKGKNI